MMIDPHSTLPFPLEPTVWRHVTPELRRTTSGIFHDLERAANRAALGPGWNPEIVQMGGFMVAIDYCFDGAGNFHSYKTTLHRDHRFLSDLAVLKHVPKAVRHIYRKDVRLMHLRALDGWDFRTCWTRAQQAWAEYWDFLGKAKP